MSQRDPNTLRDGFANLERGMNSNKAPNLLKLNEAAYLENITVRNGFAVTRPGWEQKRLKYYTGTLTAEQTAYNAVVNAFTSGKFQGASFYDDGMGRGAIVVQASGRLYLLQFQGAQLAVSDITVPSDANSTVFSRVYFQQAEEYLVVQDTHSKPAIFDGTTTRRSDVNNFEVPVGSGPMAYGNGRLWVAQGRNYIGGDLFNSDTGVLKFTENAAIAAGGAFSVPLLSGSITGMIFVAQPDTALGQGELLIFTPDAVFSCNVPINRDDWATATNPLQTIVVQTAGALGHWGISLVNADIFFRSRIGIQTIIQARRYFNTWGNVPVSNEMNRVVEAESADLLKYVSAIVFDNRLLMTCLPQALPNQCYFQGLIALDFNPISGMGEQLQPCYDGLWTGRNIYQVLKGRFNGVERAFMFSRSSTAQHIERVVLVSGGGSDLSPSSSYPPVITVTGGGGSDAQVEFTYGLIGGISGIALGSGYSVGDIIILDNGGCTCDISATMRVDAINPLSGAIMAISVLNPGKFRNITAFAKIFSQAATNGLGVGYSGWGYFQLVGVEIINPGHSYTSTPTLTTDWALSDNPIVFSVIMAPDTELWEISKNLRYDYPLDGDGNPVETDITAILETPSFPFYDAGKSNAALAKRLYTARLHVDKVAGEVTFTLQYRPDQHPCWLDWYSWLICAEKCGKAATITEFIQRLAAETGGLILTEDGKGIEIATSSTHDCQWQFYNEQYRPRMTIPEPVANVQDVSSALQTRLGREFQFRLQWEGYARIKFFEPKCKDIQEEVTPPVVETETTCRKVQCTC